MKRQHIIEKLVAANYISAKLLHGLTNEHLNNLYREVWPRILIRMERTTRRNYRHEAELAARRRFEQWQREWLKNWVHPKVKYPLIGPGRIDVSTKLDFGLNGLKETAAWLAQYNGDQDALSTLRVLSGRRKIDEDESRRQRRRNSRNIRTRIQFPSKSSLQRKT